MAPAAATRPTFYTRWLSPEGYLGLHLVVGFLVAVLAGWGFGRIADWVFASEATRHADRYAQEVAARWRTPALTDFMRFVSHFGKLWVLSVLSVDRGRRPPVGAVAPAALRLCRHGRRRRHPEPRPEGGLPASAPVRNRRAGHRPRLQLPERPRHGRHAVLRQPGLRRLLQHRPQPPAAGARGDAVRPADRDHRGQPGVPGRSLPERRRGRLRCGPLLARGVPERHRWPGCAGRTGVASGRRRPRRRGRPRARERRPRSSGRPSSAGRTSPGRRRRATAGRAPRASPCAGPP